MLRFFFKKSTKIYKTKHFALCQFLEDPWGSRSQTGSDQWWKTFKVLSLLINWDLNSERQCSLHSRNKRNPWQTWRTLIPLTTTIVDVQNRKALIYLSNFIYIIYPISAELYGFYIQWSSTCYHLKWGKPRTQIPLKLWWKTGYGKKYLHISHYNLIYIFFK